MWSCWLIWLLAGGWHDGAWSSSGGTRSWEGGASYCRAGRRQGARESSARAERVQPTTTGIGTSSATARTATVRSLVYICLSAFQVLASQASLKVTSSLHSGTIWWMKNGWCLLGGVRWSNHAFGSLQCLDTIRLRSHIHEYESECESVLLCPSCQSLALVQLVRVERSRRHVDFTSPS